MKDLLNKLNLGRYEFEKEHPNDVEGTNPFDLFQEWMTEAVKNNEREPNAFALSTVGENNQPDSRIVYLRDLIDFQFIYYTNYNSKKGKDIDANPNVSMLFFWPDCSRQVRIEGVCRKTDTVVSDENFNSRPRGSQIGAWASNQSDELRDRSELEIRVKAYEEKFVDVVPRPEHWGGYQIQPLVFEFWQGKPSRLHDRFVFTAKGEHWEVHKRNP